MPEDRLNWLILAIALFMVAAFWLGYNTAETRERRAHKQTKQTLREVEMQKRRLTHWVRKNWPNEFTAYRRGHAEGYQQGVLQAPEMEARANEQDRT